jgi:hypothetical protein
MPPSYGLSDCNWRPPGDIPLAMAACEHVRASSNRARFSFWVVDSAAQRIASSAYIRTSAWLRAPHFEAWDH